MNFGFGELAVTSVMISYVNISNFALLHIQNNSTILFRLPQVMPPAWLAGTRTNESGTLIGLEISLSQSVVGLHCSLLRTGLAQ